MEYTRNFTEQSNESLYTKCRLYNLIVDATGEIPTYPRIQSAFSAYENYVANAPVIRGHSHSLRDFSGVMRQYDYWRDYDSQEGLNSHGLPDCLESAKTHDCLFSFVDKTDLESSFLLLEDKEVIYDMTYGAISVEYYAFPVTELKLPNFTSKEYNADKYGNLYSFYVMLQSFDAGNTIWDFAYRPQTKAPVFDAASGVDIQQTMFGILGDAAKLLDVTATGKMISAGDFIKRCEALHT